MPVYNFRCPECGMILVDVYEPITAPKHSCTHCFCFLERVMGCRTAVGDEIDIEIKHGLCLPDGTPRRFRSRAELRRAERTAGMTNYVVHRPPPGTDKSKHTTSWITGPPPGVDPRPFALLSPEEQRKRHEEWLKL